MKLGRKTRRRTRNPQTGTKWRVGPRDEKPRSMFRPTQVKHLPGEIDPPAKFAGSWQDRLLKRAAPRPRADRNRRNRRSRSREKSRMRSAVSPRTESRRNARRLTGAFSPASHKDKPATHGRIRGPRQRGSAMARPRRRKGAMASRDNPSPGSRAASTYHEERLRRASAGSRPNSASSNKRSNSLRRRSPLTAPKTPSRSAEFARPGLFEGC